MDSKSTVVISDYKLYQTVPTLLLFQATKRENDKGRPKPNAQLND